MKEFLKNQEPAKEDETDEVSEEMGGEYLKQFLTNQVQNKTFFVETHGCQMNVSDTEIV